MELTFVPVPAPHIADYVVIAIFLCICLVIGVYYGYQTDKIPTLDSYFLGNRHLSLLPVALSLFVTFTSAISLMGSPVEIYLYGIRGLYAVFAYILSVMIANSTLVPLLYPLRLTSSYEYLQLRFRSKGVRTLGTMIGMLQTVSYMGVTLYAPGLALQIVAGIPLWLSIVVIGLVGTVYTMIGGIKSVVWTDAFQFVMIFIGLAAVTIKGSILMGSRYSVGEIATKGRRLEFFNFDPDPRTRYSVWGTCIGLVFSMLPNWCNQSSVQRVSSLRSVRSAKIAFWLLAPISLFFFVFLGYLGILLYSYYNALECDPIQAGFLTNFNQLMPYFVLDVLRSLPGLSGVYISCLFSGALSTLSSGINALAANTVEDILGDCVKKSKIVSQTFAAKIFVLSYGIIVIGLAYAINSIPGSIGQISTSVFGVCGGPLSGIFFLGGMIPKANWIGAMIGSVLALAFNIWITIGSQLYGAKSVKLAHNPTNGCYPNNITATMNESTVLGYYSNMNTTPFYGAGYSNTSSNGDVEPDRSFSLYDVSFVWYGLIGFSLTLIIGTIVSWLTGGDRGEPVDENLIFPIFRKICCLESNNTYEVTESNEKDLHPIKAPAKGPPVYFQPDDDDGDDYGASSF